MGVNEIVGVTLAVGVGVNVGDAVKVGVFEDVSVLLQKVKRNCLYICVLFGVSVPFFVLCPENRNM